MADFYDVGAEIAGRLRGGWTATPADRLRFENDPLIDMTDLAPFCQVEIAGGLDRAYTGHPSNRLHRVDGVVLLHLMAPQLDGLTAIRTMHRNARSVLADQSWTRTEYTIALEWEDDDWWTGRETIHVYMQGISAGGGRPATEDGSYFGASASIGFYALYLTTP
jgi:hypothetical protein